MDRMNTDGIRFVDGREICKVCGNRCNQPPINGMCWQCLNRKRAGLDECPVSSAKNLTSEPGAIVKCPCDPVELEAAITETTDTKTVGDLNYAALFSVLKDALHQAAAGKGKERHANDDPFERQSICEITRKHGLAFATGQAAKKLEESHRLLQLRGVEAATNEILGAINYAAAAVIVLQEQSEEK